MLQDIDFIRQSLELHLFFARIMKEHSFFLQVSFTPKDTELIYQADSLRMEFDKLLADTIYLSNGNVSESVLQSGEVFTPYTIAAEKATAYFTGVKIPIGLTDAETHLESGKLVVPNHALVQRVFLLNEKAMRLVSDLIEFKMAVLSGVNSCELYTTNYPLLIDHILREAKFYYQLIRRLQTRQTVDLEKDAYEQEIFWNDIMAEHSKFIRGLLDPTENELFNKANDFGNEFDNLTKEATQAMDESMPITQVTEDSLNATEEIKKFKTAGTKGILDCKVKSIIIPLLGDHTIREASHYLRLLKIFKAAEQ